ncbi:uncharacterized protein moto [Phyllopteryx taeniolatus]|uniref:uncharacterized protein moto n=1 Tax=Phyllopteryx taeniolatus TaxID=161469 RepID=UPI002AD30B4E|nr:uncharacterized protein moto [Phyllopteryx taeniolatus]
MASDELFAPKLHRQAVNGSGGNTSVSKPGFHPQEKGVAEFKLWSPNGHSDPYELRNCALNSVKSRKNTVKNEIEEEVDLQFLVSNILDEGNDTQSGFYNWRNPPLVNSLWCSKTLREDFLQYSQAEDTLPNCVPSEAFIESEVESINEQFLKKLTGISDNPHWHIGVPNGDSDSFDSHYKILPPGLPIPKMASHFPPQTPQRKYDLSADSHPANHDFPQISDIFQLQNKMSRPLFDIYGSRMSANPIGNNEQDMPEHMNQLVSGLQSLLSDEFDQGCYGCFPNMEGKTEYPEDSILEHWKFPSQAMPMLCEKQLEREFWGQNVKPAFKQNGFQEILGLENENAQYFPKIKPVSASLSLPNQYKKSINRNQYSNPGFKQRQSKMKPQRQKEKKMMSGCIEERPKTTARVAEMHRRAQVDHLGGTQRFNGENIMGNMQPFIPPAHLDTNPRSFTQLPVKPQKDTTPYGSGPAGMTPAGAVAGNGATALYSHLKGSEARNGGATCKDRDSALAASLETNPRGLMIQFYLHLDECSEQLSCLQGERKQIELILAKSFPGEWTPPAKYPPGLPLNPARINRLIVNQRQEQANVEWILYKMECECNVPLHANVRLVLNSHHQALSCVQARRGEELANASEQQGHGTPLSVDKDFTLLVIALKDLAVTTRKLRAGLWCALQMTVPTPTRRAEDCPGTNRELCAALWHSLSMTVPTPVSGPEDHPDADREEIHTHSCPYTFTL